MELLLSQHFWTVFVLQTAQVFGWYAFVVGGLALAEHIWPAGPHPTLSSRLTNFLIAGVISVIVVLLNVVMEDARHALTENGLVGVVVGSWAPTNSGEILLSTLAFVFVWDLLQYWFHRMQHDVPWLWFAHALHHDEANLNASTSMRQTMWHHVFGTVAIGIPITILLDVDLLTPLASMIFFNTYGFFNHANIRFNMGWAGRIVSGPQWHRLHHSRDPAHFNKNYAVFFPCIDMLFGTYSEPKPQNHISTGLMDREPRKLRPDSLLWDVIGRQPARQFTSRCRYLPHATKDRRPTE